MAEGNVTYKWKIPSPQNVTHGLTQHPFTQTRTHARDMGYKHKGTGIRASTHISIQTVALSAADMRSLILKQLIRLF